MTPKALFASDIDHTLTGEDHIIPDCVAEALTNLYQEGFEILLLTGRTFSFAANSTQKLLFPFYIAMQNGAEILKMPEKELFQSRLLPKSFIFDLERLTQKYLGDFVVYAGYKTGDVCYYKTNKFEAPLIKHLENYKRIASGSWKSIQDFRDIVEENIPLIKYMGPLKDLEKIKSLLEKEFSYNICLMKDAIDRNLWILLITDKEANKGSALKRVLESKKWKCPIIAAGDDNNDLCLLSEADIKIAMADGSDLLIEKADIIAEPSKNFGILEALEKAKLRLCD